MLISVLVRSSGGENPEFDAHAKMAGLNDQHIQEAKVSIHYRGAIASLDRPPERNERQA